MISQALADSPERTKHRSPAARTKHKAGAPRTRRKSTKQAKHAPAASRTGASKRRGAGHPDRSRDLMPYIISGIVIVMIILAAIFIHFLRNPTWR